jgi:gluconolactonase
MNRDLRIALALTISLSVGVSLTGQPRQLEIRGVIPAGTVPELIKDGFHGLEGPMPTPDGGLYFSDVNENRTYKLDRAGKIAIWREDTNRTNGLYLLKDGRLLCAEGNGPRILSIAPDGEATALATGWKGKALRQPNDLIF